MDKSVSKKWSNFDLSFQPLEQYVLLYPDMLEVVLLRTKPERFNLKDYKEELHKPYSQITLYMCTKSDYDGNMVQPVKEEAEVVTQNETIFRGRTTQNGGTAVHTVPVCLHNPQDVTSGSQSQFNSDHPQRHRHQNR